jgi:hypothetical protein
MTWIVIMLSCPNFFYLTIWAWWVLKEAEFNVDFKNINLYRWQNAPKKFIKEKRISHLHTGGSPYCTFYSIWEIRLSGINFFSCIFSLIQVYIFELFTLNSASFDTHKPPFFKTKKLNHYIAWSFLSKGQFTQTHFLLFSSLL